MKNRYKDTRVSLIFIALFIVIFSSNFNSSSFQLPIASAQNNYKGEADKLRQLGEQQLEAGQYVQGTETLERAMRIYQKIGEKETYKQLLERIYLIYYTRGFRNENKFKLLAQEIEKLFPKDSGEEKKESTFEFELDPQIDNLIAQGIGYQQQNNSVEAKKYLEQALSKANALGKEPEKIAALKALGTFYLYEGDYVNSLANSQQAELLSAARSQKTEKEAASGDLQKKGNHFLEIIYHRLPISFLLGETYLQQKNPSKALTYFQEADAIVAKIDKNYKDFSLPGRLTFVHPAFYLSKTYYNLGKYDLALSYAQQAIKKSENTQDSYNAPLYGVRTRDLGNGHGHILAGMALEKLGKLEQAEQEFKQAVQILEIIRKKSTLQANFHENLNLFNNQVRAASLLQRVLLAQNKSEEALAASEWGRGRLLVEAATAPRELTLKEKIDALVDAQYTPESICQEQKKLHPEVNVPEGMEHIFISSRFECDGEALIQEIKEGHLEAAQKSPEVVDTLTGASPTNTAPSDIKPPKIKQLKQVAQSHQATLVEYSIISENNFFHPDYFSFFDYGINRNTFLGEEQKLVIWVIKPTGEIKARQIDLKAQKITIKDLVANTRKTIRNHPGVQTTKQLKQLHQLLIDSITDLLPTDPEAKVVFVPHKQLFLVPFAALIDSKDKYLIEKHTIITAPSIQALEVTRQKQQQQTGKSKLAVVVGNPTMPSIPQPNNQSPIQLHNLPNAKLEGEEVAKLLNTQFLTGNQATKAQVLKQLPNARYIHLATHGLLSDYAGFGIPGAIALAPSSQDNGLLTSSEIQELNLTAELAVLSACDTGRGEITGDGVVSLSRALIVAGVPSIVVSLWSVPDAPTAELMVEFYRNFQEHKLDKAQALRKAMLKIMQTHPNPINWAAFTLIGEAEYSRS